MVDVDINPFGDHDKTDAHPDETGENIPLTPEGAMGGDTFEPDHEQETSFGEGKLKKEGSPILISTVYTRSYLSIINKSLVRHITITLDMKASKARMSHSLIKMDH